CPVRRRHAGNRRLEVGTERASRHTSHLDRRGQCLGTHCSRFEVVMAGANITGRSSPLGATVGDGGGNFSLFSPTATGVELLFFDREEDATPSRVVVIDPVTNRTYHYWHVFVPGVRSGQLYGYRVGGPSAPAWGRRFDSTKVLLDPYGWGVVVPKNYDRE